MAERVDSLPSEPRRALFVAEAAKTRRSFALRGPFGPGVAVYSTLIDTRGTPRLYASSCNAFFGMKVLRSTDLGKNFKETKSAPGFPKDDGRALANIWSLEPGSGKKDLWCGVEPASLFRSRRRRRFLGDGPGHQQPRARAQVAAGQRRPLHAHDPARRQSRAPRHLDRRPLPERGRRRDLQGVEHRASAPASRPIPIPSSASASTRSRGHHGRARPALHAEPRRLGRLERPGGPRPDIGVLRSDDHGQTWRSIAKGLPSDFGFPIVVHPHDADTVYVMPLEPATRTCPGRRARGLAQRERRRLVEPARARAAEEGELLHGPARRDGHRRAEDRPRSTSARRPASSGSAATAARSGTACSTRCRRSTA